MLALIPLIASLAPGLVRWIAGDTAGTVATQVAQVVQAATGTSTPEAAIAAAGNLPPDERAKLAVQLAQIQAQAEQAARQAELDELKAHLTDVADARARDIAIRQAGGRNVRADVMVGLTIVGILGALAFLRWAGVAAGSDVSGAVIGLIGILSKCFADAFAYEFGSSRGSAEKSEALARAASAPLAQAAGGRP